MKSTVAWMISLCLAIAMASGNVCFAQEKQAGKKPEQKTEKKPKPKPDKRSEVLALVSRLGEGKTKAVSLVLKVQGSGPREEDRVLLRKFYDYAEESYRKWSQEAADAVQHGKAPDLSSVKAKDAEKRLKELSKFATKYQERRTEEEKAISKVSSDWDIHKTGKVIQAIAKFVHDHWDTIEKVAKVIKDWVRAHSEDQETIAAMILQAGNWPDFKDIQPA